MMVMPLGGGTFTVQNKTLPGTYINFISAARADASLAERGAVAVPLVLSWGEEGKVLCVTAEDFYRDSLKLFGFGAFSEQALPLRELFQNARVAYLMRVNKGGVKASAAIATAAYAGEGGNNLRVVVEANAEDETMFCVTTFFGETVVDRQDNIKTTSQLQNNGFVNFNRLLPLQAGDVFTLANGFDGSAEDEDYAEFLLQIEAYSFNTLGLPVDRDNLKKQFADFTRRARENTGVKFQCVLYRYTQADYEGVVSVENAAGGDEPAALVYWTTGAVAGCRAGRSLTNTAYNGELETDCAYTAAQAETALKSGAFIFHRVGTTVRVLEDINTLTSYTLEKNRDFSDNQTVRLIDQIATDIAAMFNERYLGKVANDAAGRVALWSDIVAHHRRLELIGALEAFSPEDITVEQGDSKKSVTVRDCVTPTGAMTQLYMTVVVQ